MVRKVRTLRIVRVGVLPVFEPHEYQLIDFGDGRKLERFGGEILDRPSPAAAGASFANRDAWASATARFELTRASKGEWAGKPHEPWSVKHGESRLLMQLSDSGNVGLFPEQAENWDWIANQTRVCAEGLPSRRPRVLNLFAYTGGASLAAAAAGAEVAHIDSSGPTVAWAKRNAEASGMKKLPVRWLIEDAMKFAAREARRGNYYDGIIADPPTYGHGPKGRPFKFAQHLEELLALCSQLLNPSDLNGRFLLFSCHAPGFGLGEVASAVSSVLPSSRPVDVTSQPLDLVALDGRKLYAGVSARWSAP